MSMIHLEYEGGYYPYSYVDQDGRLRGTFPELWNIVAHAKGLRLNITKTQSKTQLLDNVEFNRTVTMIDSFAMSLSRFDRLLETPSFGYYELNFYEVARSADSETSELSFFTVFQWNTLLLLIVAYILLSTAEFLMSKRNPTMTVLVICRQTISILFILSLTLVVFHHAAGFRGNSFVVRQNRPTALEDLLLDVKAGRRTLLVEVQDLLPPKIQQDLNQHRAGVQYEPENRRALERLCDDHSTAILTNKNNLLELGEVRPGCELVSMTVSSDTIAQWNSYNINVYNFGKLTPSYYLFSLQARADRKLIRFVNQVLLKLYDQDRFETFWTMRSVRSLRNFPTENVQNMDYRPMNLLRLSIIFYIFIGLLVISIFVFFAELISGFSVLTVVRRSLKP